MGVGVGVWVCIIKVVGPSLHEASLSTGVNPLLCTEVGNPPSAAPEALLECMCGCVVVLLHLLIFLLTVRSVITIKVLH